MIPMLSSLLSFLQLLLWLSCSFIILSTDYGAGRVGRPAMPLGPGHPGWGAKACILGSQGTAGDWSAAFHPGLTLLTLGITGNGESSLGQSGAAPDSRQHPVSSPTHPLARGRGIRHIHGAVWVGVGLSFWDLASIPEELGLHASHPAVERREMSPACSDPRKGESLVLGLRPPVTRLAPLPVSAPLPHPHLTELTLPLSSLGFPISTSATHPHRADKLSKSRYQGLWRWEVYWENKSWWLLKFNTLWDQKAWADTWSFLPVPTLTAHLSLPLLPSLSSSSAKWGY